MHTFSERLSGRLCWALGRQRQQCTEFLSLVGDRLAGGYNTVIGPTSPSRSLLPG